MNLFQLKEAENAVSVWSSQAIYLENAESSLRTQISEMGCKISDLEIELSYTKQCLKEYNKDRNLNCSIECDDDSPIIKKKLNYCNIFSLHKFIVENFSFSFFFINFQL